MPFCSQCGKVIRTPVYVRARESEALRCLTCAGLDEHLVNTEFLKGLEKLRASPAIQRLLLDAVLGKLHHPEEVQAVVNEVLDA